MNLTLTSFSRLGAFLAINLLFVIVWGFAGIGKVFNGMPAWFAPKFGETILARFPGLNASFWLLAGSELLAFALGAFALVRGEFLGRCRPIFLTSMLVWSLFVFLQLSFGQWLTSDFNATFQLFTYFGVTLLTLHFVKLDMTPLSPIISKR
jgi:hypothetical protein